MLLLPDPLNVDLLVSHSLPSEPPHQARLRLPICVPSLLPRPHQIKLIARKITPSQECDLRVARSAFPPRYQSWQSPQYLHWETCRCSYPKHAHNFESGLLASTIGKTQTY
jgi:hypothetical protein